jgi:hypothetical protein
MRNEHVFPGIRTSFAQRQSRRGLSKMAVALLAGAFVSTAVPVPASAEATALDCDAIYDPSAVYPPLPDVEGPDVSGEAGVMMYLHVDRAVVEIDGCHYDVDRPLEIDLGRLDFVVLLVELPDRPDAKVFVTEDGEWVETVSVSGSMFSQVLTPDHALGFEVAVSGQAAPTGPLVIARPSGGNPDPK